MHPLLSAAHLVQHFLGNTGNGIIYSSLQCVQIIIIIVIIILFSDTVTQFAEDHASGHLKLCMPYNNAFVIRW